MSNNSSDYGPVAQENGQQVRATFSYAMVQELSRANQTMTGLFAGAPIGSDDERPGAPPVAALSDRFWNRRFGRDRSVVGKVIRLDRDERRGAFETIGNIWPFGSEHRSPS